MVGVVIDDAIVVLENVFHVIEEQGLDPYRGSIVGTREIGLAVLATTLSLVIVFLPVSFLSSVTGRMLYEFGLTATFAILVSMLVSFTLTPMMCARLLKPVKSRRRDAAETAPVAQEVASRKGLYRRVDAAYMGSLRLAMRHRWIVLILVAAVIASNVPLYQLVRQDYIPTNVDESEFEIRLEAREGASLKSSDVVFRAAENLVKDAPGVEIVLATIGTRGFGGVNRGEIYVRLIDSTRRTFSLGRLWDGLWKLDPGEAWRGNFSQQDVMAFIRRRLNDLPDVNVSIRNLTSLRQGAPVDIDFSVTGPDIPALVAFSDKLVKKAAEIPGIVDVYTTLRLDKPELLVNIDRERAAAVGADIQEIADTLRVAVGGDDRVSRYRDTTVDDAYDVELRLVGLDRRDVASISQLYVRARPSPVLGRRGTAVEPNLQVTVPIRIDNVVSFEFGQAAARIDRLDRQRMVAVRANVAPGYALGDRIEAMRAAAEELGIPPGFETRVLGGGRELERTLTDFLWMIVLSFVFMYIVLAAQFEHLVHPFTILLSLPLAVPFGLLSLYWGGETLNLYSAMGILVLFGVIKKNAILQVDHTNALRARGMERGEAILQANRDRLRPILMTTISFVAGLVPLLIATGPGAEERRSIAVLAVGGQTLSLLLTLLAIPVIYSFLDDLGQITSPIFGRRIRPSDGSTDKVRIGAESVTGNIAEEADCESASQSTERAEV
jgi:HAE1 family hydrophobic/amphiphilic exporter-1